MSDSTINNKAITSILWSGIEQFGSQGLSLVITIVIARLISPADYGLIAMLSIFMAISQVFINCGFSNYLIQNKNKTAQDFSTVFFLNVFIGIACYLILYLCAESIARFYNQPILSKIIKYYSIVLVISSLTLVQRTKLYIDYKYKKLSLITIISLIVAGSISILMALRGYGVWTLVAYQIIQTFTVSLLIWITTKWHPSFTFSHICAKKAFNFGSKLLGANLLSNGVANLYTLVIGKKFQVIELGFYSRGQSLSAVFPSNFANMLQQATYPVLCELQDNTIELKRMFCNYLTMAAMISFPIMAILFGTAEPLVRLILTDKWLPTVPFLQILSIAYMFDPIMRLNTIVLSVTGKTQLSLYSEILKKTTLVAILFISLSFGIHWVAISTIIYSLCDIVVVSFFVRKIIPLSLMDEIKIMIPYLCFAAIIGCLCILINLIQCASYIKLIIAILISCCIYITLLKSFKRTQFNFAVKYLKTIFRKNG